MRCSTLTILQQERSSLLEIQLIFLHSEDMGFSEQIIFNSWPRFHSYTLQFHLVIIPTNTRFLDLKIPGQAHRVKHHLENLFIKYHEQKTFHQNCFLRAALNWIIYQKMQTISVFGEFNNRNIEYATVQITQISLEQLLFE